MRFTPTATYTMLSKSASKSLTWKVYIRKTTSLIGSVVGYSGWTEATAYVNIESLDSFASQLEFSVGQFTSDSHQFKGSNITWWNANIFNATASENIEIKVEMTLSSGSLIASDIAYCFSGMVDKAGVVYDELSDSVTFNVYTSTDIGQRTSAELLSTQYIDGDCDFAGTQGLILPNISSLYLTNAAIPTFYLRSGSHTITYNYEDGRKAIKLDDGATYSLSSTNGFQSLTIGDGSSSGQDEQRITVYSPNSANLPNGNEEIVEKILVVNEGDTLPRQWYRNISAKRLISGVFNSLGVTGSYDSAIAYAPWAGGSKVSIIDGASPAGKWNINCCVSANNGMWYGVGSKLYYRTMTGDESLVSRVTLTAGYAFKRLWFNPRTEHLWGYYQYQDTRNIGEVGDSTENAVDGWIVRFPTSAIVESQSASYKLGRVLGHSLELFDISKGSGNYWYGFLGTNHAANSVISISGDTTLTATVFTSSQVGAGAGYGPSSGYAFSRFTPSITSYLCPMTIAGTTCRYHDIWWYSATAGWASVKTLQTTAPSTTAGAWYLNASYHPSEANVYFFDSGISAVRYHSLSADGITVATTVLDLRGAPTSAGQTAHWNGNIYFSTSLSGWLYQVNNGGYSAIGAGAFLGVPPIRVSNYGIGSWNGVLYGISENASLWKYDSTIGLYSANADFDGKDLTTALFDTLRSFNLVVNINPNKSALVYRRSNDSGTPITTGNTLTVAISDLSKLSKVTKAIRKCDLVEVTNGNKTFNYNGSTFNNKSVIFGQNIVNVDTPLLPNELLADLIKVFYNFFKVDRDIYSIELGTGPQFQYEVLDNANFSLASTKIAPVVTGDGFPIYKTIYQKDGSMTIEVLV